jgi:uncharacterized RDD family membrane protein YckC
MIFAKTRQRLGAFFLDYLVISLYLLFLSIIGVGLGFGPLKSVFQEMFATPERSELSAFLFLVLPVILYFAWGESSSWKATLGKRKIHICVVTVSGSRLGFPQSFIRSLLKFIPWELTHACLWRIPGWPLAPETPSPIIMIGLISVWVLVGGYIGSMLINKEGQTFYDMIAKTRVISE